jgi:hypothetical protein
MPRQAEEFEIVDWWEVEDLIGLVAAKFKTKREHWIRGSDEGLSYCPDCVEKKVEELLAEDPEGEYQVDGGWCVEGDSMPSCETCGAPLENSFTNEACDSELDHFELYGFDRKNPADCYSLSNILASQINDGSALACRVSVLAYVAKHYSLAESKRFYKRFRKVQRSEQLANAQRAAQRLKDAPLTRTEFIGMALTMCEMKKGKQKAFCAEPVGVRS